MRYIEDVNDDAVFVNQVTALIVEHADDGMCGVVARCSGGSGFVWMTFVLLRGTQEACIAYREKLLKAIGAEEVRIDD